MTRDLREQMWGAADWTKTNAQLAALHCTSRFTVSRMRRRFAGAALQRPRKPPIRKPDPMWERVNWSFSDSLISKVTGKNKNCVNKWRRKLKKPDATITLKGVERSRLFNWNLSNRQIAKRTGYEVKYISNLRKSLGAPQDPAGNENSSWLRNFAWKKVNWSLFNAEIARRLGCSPNTVMRARMKFGKPGPLTKNPRRSYRQWLEKHQAAKRAAYKRAYKL